MWYLGRDSPILIKQAYLGEYEVWPVEAIPGSEPFLPHQQLRLCLFRIL